VHIQTPPPGEWHDHSPVTVLGYGPQGELQWRTVTYDGTHWTPPEELPVPTQLPAPPPEEDATQLPEHGGEATQLPGGRPPRPGRPTPR
jgi:hypothetical protein